MDIKLSKKQLSKLINKAKCKYYQDKLSINKNYPQNLGKLSMKLWDVLTKKNIYSIFIY